MGIFGDISRSVTSVPSPIELVQLDSSIYSSPFPLPLPRPSSFLPFSFYFHPVCGSTRCTICSSAATRFLFRFRTSSRVQFYPSPRSVNLTTLSSPSHPRCCAHNPLWTTPFDAPNCLGSTFLVFVNLCDWRTQLSNFRPSGLCVPHSLDLFSLALSNRGSRHLYHWIIYIPYLRITLYIQPNIQHRVPPSSSSRLPPRRLLHSLTRRS